MRTSLVLIATLFFGATQAQEEKMAYIPALLGFYNVENLYDTLDAPDVDDAEFLPESSKFWGTERYFRKINKMAGVIADMGKDVQPNGLALIGLCEVENKNVLNDLVAADALKARGMKIVHEDCWYRRGVDVALLYDPAQYTVFSHKAYRLYTADTTFKTRDQLLVSGILDGDTTHVIVNHWPSRRGGEKRSQPLREAAADLGRHIVDSLLRIDPNAHILYMGGLNDDPVNPSVQKHMRATGDKKLVTGVNFFNPMHALYQKGIGSLAWRDSWNLFDQILISPGMFTGAGGAYKYYGTRVFNEAYLRQKDGSYAGYPSRTFVGDTYQDGYSDHFPVFLILVKEAK